MCPMRWSCTKTCKLYVPDGRVPKQQWRSSAPKIGGGGGGGGGAQTFFMKSEKQKKKKKKVTAVFKRTIGYSCIVNRGRAFII